MEKKILQDPLSKSKYGEPVDTDFWAFVESCLGSDACRKINKLDLTSLAIREWNESLSRFRELFGTMNEVCNLSLTFNETWDNPDAANLMQLKVSPS